MDRYKTDRQTDRQTDRDGQTDRQTDWRPQRRDRVCNARLPCLDDVNSLHVRSLPKRNQSKVRGATR